jgi:hypothetical protein
MLHATVGILHPQENQPCTGDAKPQAGYIEETISFFGVILFMNHTICQFERGCNRMPWKSDDGLMSGIGHDQYRIFIESQFKVSTDSVVFKNSTLPTGIIDSHVVSFAYSCFSSPLVAILSLLICY